jgi:ABC-type branched-subunit amino acid transport system substrate-binding protein
MTANDLDRRAFVRAAGALLLAGSDFRFAPPSRVQDALRICFVPGRDAAASAARGVTLGVEEAARTGQLVGRRIELVTVDSVEAAAGLRGDARASALIGGFDDTQCEALVKLAHRTGVLMMNVGCRADGWRAEACARNVFHVEASESMYADALAARGEDGEVAASAALWHPSLERFGAAQLNDRFRARFGGEMDGPAWAGWMGVKVLWEASLRTRTTDSRRLRAYMESGRTEFDGHKGWPLSFREWNHQLRQPLYLVGGPSSRVVGETPTRRAGEESSSRGLLDVLGDTDLSRTLCRMGW